MTSKRSSLQMVLLLALVWGLLLPAAAYEANEDLKGATVRGQVVYDGRLPKLKASPVHRDSAVCGPSMPNEALAVDPSNQGIAAVVVSIEGIDRGKALPKEQTIVVRNLTCRFIERTSAATVGASLELRNDDPILHNTHVRRETKFGPTVINVAQPVGVRAILKSLHEPDFLDVRCDAHPFMRASVHVFDHPYHTVTNSEGRFELTDVPPGTYTIRAWHELLGTDTTTVTVPAAGALSVKIRLTRE